MAICDLLCAYNLYTLIFICIQLYRYSMLKSGHAKIIYSTFKSLFDF